MLSDHKVERLQFWASMVLMIATAVFVFWLLRNLFLPMKVLEVNGKETKVVHQTLHPGDNIEVYFSACKNVAAVAEVATTIYGNELRIELPPSKLNLPLGCYSGTVVTTRIPLAVPPGVYAMRTTIRYRLNALRDATYTFKTGQLVIEP